MARLLRVEFAGAIYHVTVRGNERRLIFKDDQDRKRFLENLAQGQQLHQPRLYLVCLMPNHFHLLLETPGANLSAFMAGLLTGYAIHFNRRHHRVGHLTQGRYKAQVVEGNDYLLKLTRYIPEEILETVASLLGIAATDLRRRSRNSTRRAVAAWALIRHGGLTGA